MRKAAWWTQENQVCRPCTPKVFTCTRGIAKVSHALLNGAQQVSFLWGMQGASKGRVEKGPMLDNFEDHLDFLWHWTLTIHPLVPLATSFLGMVLHTDTLRTGSESDCHFHTWGKTQITQKSTHKIVAKDTNNENINLFSRWMKDDEVHICSLCNNKFTQIRRKHHCRQCGHVFCNKCSEQKVSQNSYASARHRKPHLGS